MLTNFSNDARETVRLAQAAAFGFKTEYVDAEHILVGLTQDNTGVGLILQQQGVPYHEIRQKLLNGGFVSSRNPYDILFSTEALSVFSRAANLAATYKHAKVTNVHLLMALLTSDEAINSATEIFGILSVDLEIVARRVDVLLKLTQPKKELAIFDGATIQLPGTSTVRVVSDYFSDKTSLIMNCAQKLARQSKEQLVGLHHLLLATQECDENLNDCVAEIINCIGFQKVAISPDIFQDHVTSESCFFTDEAKNALLAARSIASIIAESTINPSILLCGILAQAQSAILFDEADLDKLSEIKNRLYLEIVDDIGDRPKQTKTPPGEIDTSLYLGSVPYDLSCQSFAPDPPQEVLAISRLRVTERVLRILRFSKEEAVFAQQRSVMAPQIVLALTRESVFSEAEFMVNRDRSVEAIAAEICKEYRILRQPQLVSQQFPISFAPEIKQLMLCAYAISQRLRMPCIDLNHIAMAVFEQHEKLAEIVVRNIDTSTGALMLRLSQCSLRQHHLSHSSSEGPVAPVAIDLLNLDKEITVTAEGVRVSLSRQSSMEMPIEELLSRRSERVFGFAVNQAKNFGHSSISVETILLGLLLEAIGITLGVFSLLGINFVESREKLTTCCLKGSERSAALRPLSTNGRRLVERALAIAKQWKSQEIEPEHLLLAIAEEHRGIAAFACEALCLDGDLIRLELLTAMRESRI